MRSLGPRTTGDADLGLDRGEVAPAEPRNHDLPTAAVVRQSPGDPLGAHQGRHGAAEDRDIVVEVQLEPVESLVQRVGGEPAGHEQRIGHDRSPLARKPLIESGVPGGERLSGELGADLRHGAEALGEGVVLVDALEVLLAGQDE